MTCRDRLKMEHPEFVSNACIGGCKGCPHDYGYLPKPDYCGTSTSAPKAVNDCVMCWDREIPESVDIPQNKFPLYPIDTEDEKNIHTEWPKDNLHITDAAKKAGELLRASVNEEPHIKDSGDRTQFETGAVRDMREGKGRCDLMPLKVVASYVGDDGIDPVLSYIDDFQKCGETWALYNAIAYFDELHWDNCYTMLLEVAKHFEEGAKKYGENNWQKGIPVHCYIDSAVRHYLKWLRGDTDEPHDRAFVWNLMCCIWEVDYHKEE